MNLGCPFSGGFTRVWCMDPQWIFEEMPIRWAIWVRDPEGHGGSWDPVRMNRVIRFFCKCGEHTFQMKVKIALYFQKCWVLPVCWLCSKTTFVLIDSPKNFVKKYLILGCLVVRRPLRVWNPLYGPGVVPFHPFLTLCLFFLSLFMFLLAQNLHDL